MPVSRFRRKHQDGSVTAFTGPSAVEKAENDTLFDSIVAEGTNTSPEQVSKRRRVAGSARSPGSSASRQALGGGILTAALGKEDVKNMPDARDSRAKGSTRPQGSSNYHRHLQALGGSPAASKTHRTPKQAPSPGRVESSRTRSPLRRGQKLLDALKGSPTKQEGERWGHSFQFMEEDDETAFESPVRPKVGSDKEGRGEVTTRIGSTAPASGRGNRLRSAQQVAAATDVPASEKAPPESPPSRRPVRQSKTVATREPTAEPTSNLHADEEGTKPHAKLKPRPAQGTSMRSVFGGMRGQRTSPAPQDKGVPRGMSPVRTGSSSIAKPPGPVRRETSRRSMSPAASTGSKGSKQQKGTKRGIGSLRSVFGGQHGKGAKSPRQTRVSRSPSRAMEANEPSSPDVVAYAAVDIVSRGALAESGAATEAMDDIDFALDGVNQGTNIPALCLDALELSKKFSTMEMRLMMRAHDKVSAVLQGLLNACKKHNSPALRLCLASVLFNIMKERENGEYVTTECVEWMLGVLDVNSLLDLKWDKNVGASVVQFIESVEGSGLDLEHKELHCMTLILHALTNGTKYKGAAALDVLCQEKYFTTLRELLGDCIYTAKRTNEKAYIDMVISTLEVLENLTFPALMPDKEQYDLDQQFMLLLGSLLGWLKHGAERIMSIRGKPGTDEEVDLLSEAVLCVLKVLLNISNENERICTNPAFCAALGDIARILCLPDDLPDSHDLTTMCLGVLINSVEAHAANKDAIRLATVVPYGAKKGDKGKSALKLIVEMFVGLMDGVTEDDVPDCDDKTRRITAAYTAALAGFLVTDNKANMEEVVQIGGDGVLGGMAMSVRSLLKFEHEIGNLSDKTRATYQSLIKVLDPDD